MDASNLSSNWKALQKTLKPAEPLSKPSSLKRKRPDQDSMSASSNRLSRSRSKSSSNFTKPQFSNELRSTTSYGSLKSDIAQTDLKSFKNEGVSPTALPGKYVALDCEMVGVGPPPHSDHQLARVSIVNWHGEQVYDTFVLPQLPVTDYRTSVSGIRPADLEVGRPFKEVKEDVEIFLGGRILVGHWLKSDLECLGLKHPREKIRDTAKLAKFRDLVGGGNVKLKVLAKKILSLDIQGGEHDSIEDARTAMMLFKVEREAFEGEKSSQNVFRLAAANLDGEPEVKQKDKKNKRKKRR